jgi:hypothetical protein
VITKRFLIVFITGVVTVLAAGSFFNWAFSSAPVSQPPPKPKYRVTLYSGEGRVIRMWNTDMVQEGKSGMARFSEFGTGSEVQISGTIVVERIR